MPGYTPQPPRKGAQAFRERCIDEIMILVALTHGVPFPHQRPFSWLLAPKALALPSSPLTGGSYCSLYAVRAVFPAS